MTAQIPDEFTYQNENFSLVGLKGNGLLKPQELGIIPYFRCTACWRGYVMEYTIINNQLILSGMRVNTKKPIEINKVNPQQGGDLFDYYYKDLNFKTNFTGKLLLAKDFINSMYVHMGFQRPMSFKTVLEIHFENGNITLLRDLSKKMEEFRKQDIYKEASPKSNSTEDVENWVKKTFSLDYDF